MDKLGSVVGSAMFMKLSWAFGGIRWWAGRALGYLHLARWWGDAEGSGNGLPVSWASSETAGRRGLPRRVDPSLGINYSTEAVAWRCFVWLEG